MYGRRGFSWRNGLLGSMFLDDDGFFVGFIGSRDIVYECEDCGYVWKVEDKK